MKQVIASLTFHFIIKQTRVVVVGVCEFLDDEKTPTPWYVLSHVSRRFVCRW